MSISEELRAKLLTGQLLWVVLILFLPSVPQKFRQISLKQAVSLGTRQLLPQASEVTKSLAG